MVEAEQQLNFPQVQAKRINNGEVPQMFYISLNITGLSKH